MFDVVGLGVDYADDQRFVVRELHVLPHRPLVFVPRISRFDVDELRARLEDQLDDVL